MNLVINLEVSERAGSGIFRNLPNSEVEEGAIDLVLPFALALALEEEAAAWNLGPPAPFTAARAALPRPIAAIF